MAARKEKSGKRGRRLNDAEKCDLVDRICKEETTNADGDPDGPDLVKRRSKTVCIKEETSLNRSLSCRLNNLQGEDMKSGIPKGLNARGAYSSVTIYGLKTC